MAVILLYIPIIIVVLAVAVLAMRLRVRVDLSGERRLLFVGLGHSGPEFDFAENRAVIRIAGFTVRRFSLDRKPKKARKRKVKTSRQKQEKLAAEAKQPKQSRGQRLREVLDLLPAVSLAVGKYFLGLLKAVIVEQAEGQIEAGFEEPHITGQVYGYYQAVAAMVPVFSNRIQFVPNWSENMVDGRVQVTVAVPFYRVVGQSIVLLWRLPKRKLIRLIRGKSRKHPNT